MFGLTRQEIVCGYQRLEDHRRRQERYAEVRERSMTTHRLLDGGVFEERTYDAAGRLVECRRYTLGVARPSPRGGGYGGRRVA